MERGYQILLRENDLTEAELPKDAKVLISSIRDGEKAMKLNSSKGKTITETAKDKLRLLDEQAVAKILEYIEEKEEQEELRKKEQEEEERKKNEGKLQKTEESKNAEEPDAKGLKVDQELAAAILAGKTKLTQEELKELAPVAYDLVFDNYEQGGENGVQTSFYSLIEKENLFHISKN